MAGAAKDGFGGAAGRNVRAAGGNPWRRLWQVPLLLAGIIAFGFGIRAFVGTIRQVPFEQQVKGVEALIAQEKYAEAIKEINTLAPYYKEALQQGELQKLAGDATFLAQRQSPTLVRVNYERVTDHYAKAVAWGLIPTVEMNERWGEAALALGDAGTAVEKLEAAIATSGGGDLLLQRHVRNLVAAYLDARQPAKALALVNRMLEAGAGKVNDTDMEAIEQRTWGLCKRIEIALAAGDDNALDRAVTGAREALATLPLKDPGGRVLVWIGRAELEKGQMAAAERDLAEARRRFAVHHLDDGRAAVLLGKIVESRGDLDAAATLFQEVVTGQVGTSVWAAARLGRADVAVRRGTLDGELLMGDYRYALAAAKDALAPVGKRPEMVGTVAVRASLLEAYQRALDAGKLEPALEFIALAQQTEERPTAEMVYRLATTKERRGLELLGEARMLEGVKNAQMLAAARARLADAAENYLLHAKMSTLNDEQSGNSLWKAGQLLDAAGETMRAADVYERFTIQRPRDARAAEGLLALGRLYESAGMTDQALGVYQRNIRDNPNTPATYTSVVNQARCYAALAGKAATPEEKKALLDKAEQALLGLVQDNTNLQPSAREFRASLLALGELYYHNQRWGDAILRLDEVVTRYPNDPAVPRVTFLLAESYRKSAGDINAALTQPAVGNRAALEKWRGERLLAAAGYFSRVIALLDVESLTPVSASGGKKLTALEQQYLRSSYMERAECHFERGDYEQAVKLYDETSVRFSEEVLAVEAYVQIVNAYLKLNQPAQANAAAARGQWILQRVPDAAWKDVAGTREYYTKLLALK